MLTHFKKVAATSLFNAARWIFITLLVSLFTLPASLFSQDYAGLSRLKGYQTSVYHSEGAKERAKTLAGRYDNVLRFYKEMLVFEPSVVLLVLSPEDWSKYTNFPVYGMPHYDDKKTLIVASEDNAFWKSFIPPVSQLPKALAEQITSTYSDKNGALSMQSFFDLLAIHELGHAYHFQRQLTMQRKWMGELFANIFLHTYIAENEPGLLPALTVFPKMVVAGDKSGWKYTRLNDLENNYDLIGQQYPQNYGWYQSRWHIAAGNIYDTGGIAAFKNLWSLLQSQQEILDDGAFAKLLAQKAHQSIADVYLKWDE